jgi:hypothetical protein
MREKDKSLFTVVTVNYNTSDFVRLMYEVMRDLANSPFVFMVCDNGSSRSDQDALKRYFAGNENADLLFRHQGDDKASFAHAKAMDLLLSKVTTKYAVVMDSDCVLLAKGWDDVLRATMQANVVVGTSSPSEYAGNRVGATTFPLPFAMVLDMDVFRELCVSFLPGDISRGEDTAWQLKHAYEQRALPFRIWDSYNTRTFLCGPFAGLEGVGEYYQDNVLMASHFGRGSSCGIAKYFKGGPQNVIFNFFRRMKGIREKKVWMSICRDIAARHIEKF